MWKNIENMDETMMQPQRDINVDDLPFFFDAYLMLMTTTFLNQYCQERIFDWGVSKKTVKKCTESYEKLDKQATSLKAYGSCKCRQTDNRGTSHNFLQELESVGLSGTQ